MKNNKWKCIKETTEKSFDFMNKSELQRSFEDILNKTIDQWKENDDKDSLDMAEQGETWIDDYINDPEWGLVASTMRDMEKYVHRSDTGMSGNFADIRLDWERDHEDVSLDEVVDMIDNGEVNDITNEFRSWSIDWYFRAFGTYNLKYNWSEFISNEVAEMDYERERDSKVDESSLIGMNESRHNRYVVSYKVVKPFWGEVSVQADSEEDAVKRALVGLKRDYKRADEEIEDIEITNVKPNSDYSHTNGFGYDDIDV